MADYTRISDGPTSYNVCIGILCGGYFGVTLIMGIIAVIVLAIHSPLHLPHQSAYVATVAADNVVVAAGGLTASGLYDGIIRIDATRPPKRVASLSIGRANITLSLLYEFVIVAAGGTTGRRVSSNVVDVICTDSWRRASATLNVPRYMHAAASLSSGVLVAGGYSSPGVVTASVEFILADNNCSSVQVMQFALLSEARAQLAGCAAHNVTVFAGGINTAGAAVAIVDIYNGTTGELYSWSLPSGPRHSLACTQVGDWIVFAGGFSGSNGSTTLPSDAVDALNVVTREWEYVQLSSARGALAATSIGTKVYIAGGIDSRGKASKSVDVFNTYNWPLQDPVLLKHTSTLLSEGQAWLSASSVSGHSFFLGGVPSMHPFELSSSISTIPGTSNCALRLHTLLWRGVKASWLDLTALPSLALSIGFLLVFLIMVWRSAEQHSNQNKAITLAILCIFITHALEVVAIFLAEPRSFQDRLVGALAYFLTIVFYWWCMSLMIYTPYEDLQDCCFPPPCTSFPPQQECFRYTLFPMWITIVSLLFLLAAIALEVKYQFVWPFEAFYIVQAIIHVIGVITYVCFTRPHALSNAPNIRAWWSSNYSLYFYAFLGISLVHALVEIAGTALASGGCGWGWCVVGFAAALEHLFPVQVIVIFFIDWCIKLDAPPASKRGIY